MSATTAPPPIPEVAIAPAERGRRIRAAFAFALVLFCVYQTLSLTDVTDDVIRLGIEADSYEMAWTGVSWVVLMIFGLFVGASAVGRYGSRLVLVVGLAVFALGNLLGGMAVSLETMVLARGVEGVGKGLATLAGRSSLYAQFDRSLIFAIGFYGVFAYATRYSSPLIAATLNDQLSWRWIYWANVPVALAALVAVLATFRPDRPAEPKPLRVAWTSFALVGTWVAALILSSGWYRYWNGWTSDWFVALVALDVLCPVVLLGSLLLGPAPDGHLARLLRSRVAVLAMTTRAMMLVYMSAVLSIMGSYLTSMRGYPRPVAGWVLAPTTLTMTLATVLTTVYHRRSLRHVWLFVAVVGCSASLWWLSGVDNFTPKGRVAAILATWGLFMGLFPPVFLTDEVEGRNPKDATFAATVSLAILFLSMALIPTITKNAIQGWTARAEDSMRLDVSPNRPEVADTVARVEGYYLRGGLTPTDAGAATKELVGQYVGRESTARGLRWGLQMLSLVMLAFGLVVAIRLARAAGTLRSPPGSGYL